MDVTNYIVAGVGLVSIVVGVILIPYLIKKFGKEKVLATIDALDYLLSIARTFVKSIEQMYPDWSGEKKLAEVTIKIKLDLEEHGITFDESKIRAAIEQAVFEMNKSLFGEVRPLEPIEGVITTDSMEGYSIIP